jgi:WD40 repeat protein
VRSRVNPPAKRTHFGWVARAIGFPSCATSCENRYVRMKLEPNEVVNDGGGSDKLRTGLRRCLPARPSQRPITHSRTHSSLPAGCRPGSDKLWIRLAEQNQSLWMTVPSLQSADRPGPSYELQCTLVGHHKGISSVQFSPDGKLLATSCK